MKLGISTWAYLDLSLDQALDRISLLSSRAEILCEGRHSLFRPESMEAAISHSLKYSVHGPIADINIASIYPEFREASVKLHKRAIEAGAAAGAELYIIHPGYTPWSFCWMDALTCLDRSLEELAPLQEELGIDLAVENMPNSEWLLFKRPDIDLHGMGLVLDVGHANTCGTLMDFLDHPALRHIHLHDNCGDGDMHLSLGKGSVDLVSVLKRLREGNLTAALEQKSENDVMESLSALERLREAIAPRIMTQ
ncbi:MAG: sugar phosphate isomerase/epimerase family protein [Methanothrix sp.]